MLGRALLSIALIFSFWLPYVFWKSTWYGADLMANLFAGAIDIVITLVGVDTIIRLSERRRSRPIRYAIYSESRIVLVRILTLWIEMIKCSSQNYQLLTGDILAERLVEQVSYHFDLSANTNHPQYASWPLRIQISAQEIQNRLNQIFTRYPSSIDIDLFSCLQEIEAMPTLHFMLLANLVYTTGDIGTAETRRCFSIVENFQGTDRVVIEKFQRILSVKAKEFEGTTGFYPPRELSFTDEDLRNDIWPALGSAYR